MADSFGRIVPPERTKISSCVLDLSKQSVEGVLCLAGACITRVWNSTSDKLMMRKETSASPASVLDPCCAVPVTKIQEKGSGLG